MGRSIMVSGLVITIVGVCQAQIQLTGDTVFTFAPADEGRRILTARDDFVRALSPFDRAARVKTDRDVSEKEFLEFVGQNVLDWSDSEKAMLTSALNRLRTPFDRLALPWPKGICAIKTTGKEEGGAPYTRRQALILPQRLFAPNRPLNPRLVAHELFHILSRSNPALRDRLYQAIGFVRCTEIELPQTLKSRKITNPDAPTNDHCIRVQVAGEDVWAVPILFSQTERYDVQQGGEFFRYLQFRLLLANREGDSPVLKPTDTDQQPRLVDVAQVTGFYEQIGRNTEYIIHPEEILADNFVSLVLQDPNVPSPEVLKRLRDALTEKPAQEGK